MKNWGSRLAGFFDAFKSDAGAFSADHVVYEGDSPFHHIIIREEGSYRTMYFGPEGEEAETAINLENPSLAVFEYPGMMLAALPLFPEGKRVVMLGLGGGFLPNLFQQHLPQYELTVVEIDFLVAELAQTYFGFTPGENVRLAIEDGLIFLANQPEASCGQIWLDAFSGDYVPDSLSGLKFLELCRSRLTPGGLLVQNLHQSRPRTFQNQLKTTEAAFGSFVAFDGSHCGNAIVVSAAPGGRPWPPTWRKTDLVALAKKFGPRLGPYDLVAEMRKFRSFIPDADAVVLR